MKLKDRIVARLNKNTYTAKLIEYNFRTILFTVVSLAVTTGYAIFYAALGIAMHSVWHGMLAWYYMMLVVMRAFVVFYHRKRGKRKRRGEEVCENGEQIVRAHIYRNCGITVALLALPLSLAILQMVEKGATFEHAGLMIYVAATYTTYKVVMSLRHYAKTRTTDELTVKTVRCINLADMLVSVLALQTAMLNSFSESTNYGVYNAITGAVVCLLTVALGVAMAVNGGRTATRLKQAQTDERDRPTE